MILRVIKGGFFCRTRLHGRGRQDSDHILTSCPTYADMRNEVLWNEAREPDYRRILSQGPLVKKAAQFMLRTRLLGQFRTLPHPTEFQPAARRTSIRLQSGTYKLRRSPCSLPLGASSPLHPLYIALGLCKPSSCLSFCQSVNLLAARPLAFRT